jgi:putative ABC transport system permease protein
MVSPRWRKVFRDLWRSKSRTLLVALSVAVGVFSVGVILNTQHILNTNFERGFDETNATSAIIQTDAIDATLLASIRAVPGVTDAEGKHVLMTRFSITPGEWINMEITAVENFDAVRINRFESDSGAWPPPAGEILIERSALDVPGLKHLAIGNDLTIQALDGTQPVLRVAGIAYDFNRTPSQGSGIVYGYITFDTLPLLGSTADFNTLQLVVEKNRLTERGIRAITDQVGAVIENSGRRVYSVIIPPPGEHPLNGPISALLLLMGVLGAISLLASSLLVINTISALLAQQVRQIGVIKAVGGRTSQLLIMYLSMVTMLGLLALLIAVPLGIAGGIAFASFLAWTLNLDISSYPIAPIAILAQVAVGVFVPLLAAFYPILSRTRITVRQAIDDYGSEVVRSRLMRGLTRLSQSASSLNRLALRNPFRRQGRLVYTLITLSLSGMLFISIMSVRESLFSTLDEATAYRDYDLRLDFGEAYPAKDVIREALAVPGVTRAEGFSFTSRAMCDSQNISVFALPPSNTMFRPPVSEGRWLLPDDENSVVINTALQRDQPGIRVGDAIRVHIEGRETTVRVVGVFDEMVGAPGFYINLPFYARLVGEDGRVNSVWITTERHGEAAQNDAVKALETRFADAGWVITASYTFHEWRSFLAFHFDIITVFLMVMAVILATVGGLGLMGTMGINVIERTREIGILRAVGASNRAVLRVFVAEGVVIGLLSWLVSSLIAFPPGKHLSDAVGITFLEVPLHYTFSLTGILLWVVIVMILAALASSVPAYRAARMSVHDVLAYE